MEARVSCRAIQHARYFAQDRNLPSEFRVKSINAMSQSSHQQVYDTLVYCIVIALLIILRLLRITIVCLPN